MAHNDPVAMLRRELDRLVAAYPTMSNDERRALRKTLALAMTRVAQQLLDDVPKTPAN
jgi:hypothetical protein